MAETQRYVLTHCLFSKIVNLGKAQATGVRF